MKIIVFGATGRVGACVVEQAIAAGHDVTVFVRDRRRLKVGGDNVAIVEGDVRDQAAVRSSLEPGFDAVVVAIGETALKASTLVTDGMHTIITAMKDRGIARLLFVSGVAEMPNKTFFGKLMAALLKITPVGHAIRDHDRAFEELKHSGLQWMVAGGPYIKDGPRVGKYQTSQVYPGGFKIIHPPDIADLVVRELTEQKFTGSVVGIWY
jgi:putative NADH-flavin reductase